MCSPEVCSLSIALHGHDHFTRLKDIESLVQTDGLVGQIVSLKFCSSSHSRGDLLRSVP